MNKIFASIFSLSLTIMPVSPAFAMFEEVNSGVPGRTLNAVLRFAVMSFYRSMYDQPLPARDVPAAALEEPEPARDARAAAGFHRPVLSPLRLPAGSKRVAGGFELTPNSKRVRKAHERTRPIVHPFAKKRRVAKDDILERNAWTNCIYVILPYRLPPDMPIIDLGGRVVDVDAVLSQLEALAQNIRFDHGRYVGQVTEGRSGINTILHRAKGHARDSTKKVHRRLYSFIDRHIQSGGRMYHSVFLGNIHPSQINTFERGLIRLFRANEGLGLNSNAGPKDSPDFLSVLEEEDLEELLSLDDLLLEAPVRHFKKHDDEEDEDGGPGSFSKPSLFGSFQTVSTIG